MECSLKGRHECGQINASLKMLMSLDLFSLAILRHSLTKSVGMIKYSLLSVKFSKEGLCLLLYKSTRLSFCNLIKSFLEAASSFNFYFKKRKNKIKIIFKFK